MDMLATICFCEYSKMLPLLQRLEAWGARHLACCRGPVQQLGAQVVCSQLLLFCHINQAGALQRPWTATVRILGCGLLHCFGHSVSHRKVSVN